MRKGIFGRIILYVVLLIVLAPLVVMILGSLKTNTQLMQIPPNLWPINLTGQNYEFLFKRNVLQSALNSLIVVLGTTALVVVLDSMAGYVFARKRFPGKNFFFALLLSTMMIPRQILMVPTYLLVVKLGLHNNLLGAILSAGAAPFGVFLLKQNMQTLPGELFDAAEIDGCSEARMFLQIALPLSKAALMALSIFLFVGTWNDFIWQLIILSGKKNMTMPIFLMNLISERASVPAYQFAGAVLATVPIVIVFLFGQRFFISGITVGAVKG
jgi:multiple sugar transport system permease protein